MGMADPAAERGVLGGVFHHGADAFLDVQDTLTPSSFTVDSNAVLYKCLSRLFEEDPQATPDLPSLLSAANALGLGARLQEREESKHLRAVLNTGPSVALPNVRKMAGKVRRLEVARLLHQQLGNARASLEDVSGDEPIAHVLGLAENPIFDFTSLLADAGSRGLVKMGEGSLDYVKYLFDNPRESAGIPTGFRLWDAGLGGGMRPGCLDVVGARQKTGKTVLVDTVCLNVSARGVPVLNVDLEMTREEHLNRILATLSGQLIEEIERGVADRGRVEEAAAQLEALPYTYLAAAGMSFEDVLACMRRWVKREVGLDPETGKARPCLIVYDWLKLNSPGEVSKHLQEYQQLGYVTSGLKNFMGRHGVSCLTFCQLNRDGIDVEDTSVVRGSDRILDFCTSFSLFKWKTDEEMSQELGEAAARFTHKMITLLSRFGPGHRKGEFIHVETDYARARVREGPFSRSVLSKKGKKTPGGYSDAKATGVPISD